MGGGVLLRRPRQKSPFKLSDPAPFLSLVLMAFLSEILCPRVSPLFRWFGSQISAAFQIRFAKSLFLFSAYFSQWKKGSSS